MVQSIPSPLKREVYPFYSAIRLLTYGVISFNTIPSTVFTTSFLTNPVNKGLIKSATLNKTFPYMLRVKSPSGISRSNFVISIAGNVLLSTI